MSAVRQDQCPDFAAGGRVRDHVDRLIELDCAADERFYLYRSGRDEFGGAPVRERIYERRQNPDFVKQEIERLDLDLLTFRQDAQNHARAAGGGQMRRLLDGFL